MDRMGWSIDPQSITERAALILSICPHHPPEEKKKGFILFYFFPFGNKQIKNKRIEILNRGRWLLLRLQTRLQIKTSNISFHFKSAAINHATGTCVPSSLSSRIEKTQTSYVKAVRRSISSFYICVQTDLFQFSLIKRFTFVFGSI